jgi:hypothetical protein
MIVDSQTIPAWVIAFVMLYTALIWLLSIKQRVRMDSRIIAGTLIIQGLIYEVVFQFVNPGAEIRGFFSRLMVLMLCLSQALPLTISYFRSLKRGD